MEIYKKALITALKWAAFGNVELVVLYVIILVMVGQLIKHEYLPKRAFWIFAVFCTVVLALGSVRTVRIVLDLNNNAYVTYYGRYKQIVEGDDLYQTTVLLDGKKVRLFSAYSISVKGEHTGYVVYSERSEFVVYVGEELPESITKPLPQIPQEE